MRNNESVINEIWGLSTDNLKESCSDYKIVSIGLTVLNIFLISFVTVVFYLTSAGIMSYVLLVSVSSCVLLFFRRLQENSGYYSAYVVLSMCKSSNVFVNSYELSEMGIKRIADKMKYSAEYTDCESIFNSLCRTNYSNSRVLYKALEDGLGCKTGEESVETLHAYILERKAHRGRYLGAYRPALEARNEV